MARPRAAARPELGQASQAKNRPPSLRTSTTTRSGFWEMDLGALGSYRSRPPEDAERAVDAAFQRAGLVDPTAADAEIERHAQLYRERRNPFDALEAFVLCRRAGVSIPEWILAYLEGALKRLLVRVRGIRARAAREREIARAFELVPARRPMKGRTTDAVEQLDADDRDAKITMAVLQHRLAGASREKAIAEVSKKFDLRGLRVSESTVRRALKKHRR